MLLYFQFKTFCLQWYYFIFCVLFKRFFNSTNKILCRTLESTENILTIWKIFVEGSSRGLKSPEHFSWVILPTHVHALKWWGWRLFNDVGLLHKDSENRVNCAHSCLIWHRHFWEFSNSGLKRSKFHFFNKILIQVLLSQLSVLKNNACASILYFQGTSKVFLKAHGYRSRFSVAAATARWGTGLSLLK